MYNYLFINLKTKTYVSHILTPLMLVPLKWPLPRPPARTWAFKTMSLVCRLAAIFDASSGDLATPNFGVGIPASFKRL